MRLIVLLGLLALACLGTAADVILRLSSWEGDEALKIQRQAIAEFEKAHPGIRVKIENNDYGVYFQKLLTQVASGTAPDVSMMTFEHFASFGKRHALVPLDDLCAQATDFKLSDYYPEIVRAHRYDGKLYVLPRDIAPHGLIYYNRKLFREAGIPYPKTSWTWDYQERPELKENDFLWVMHQLTKFGKDGRPTQWGFACEPAFLARTFALSQGARFLDDDEHPTRVLTNSPLFVQSYELADQLSFRKHWMPTLTELETVMQTDAGELFRQGKLAMVQGGIWEVPNMRRGLVPGKPGFFDWDITLMPAFKDGRRAFSTGGSGYSILAQSKHPEEAWELVKWMSGPRGLQGLAESGLAQPAIRKMALSEPWIPGPDTPEAMRWPPSRLITDEAVQYVVFPPTTEYWNDLFDFVNNRVNSIWSRELTPKQALDLGTKEAQTRLDQLNKVEQLPEFSWPFGLTLACGALLGLGGWVALPNIGKSRTLRQRRTNASAYKFLAPWLIGFCAFTAGPMLFSLLMSFTDWDMILPARGRGLGNYIEAFTIDPKFWVSIRVTCVYTFVSVPIGLMTSLAIALLLNQPIKGIPFFRTCFYIPTVGSAVATTVIWKRLFQPQTGLINTLIYGFNGQGNLLGLASLLHPFVPPGQTQVDWLGSERTALASLIIMSLWGFASVIVLLAGLQGIPAHYYEAAMLDGANARRRFWHVTLPLLSPAIFFSLVTGFIGSFQTFTQSYVLTSGGPGDATQFYMLNLYKQAFQSLRMGYAAALAWILFFIILGFTILQFRASKWVHSEAT
jgi:multiple sugar transport system permease protein